MKPLTAIKLAGQIEMTIPVRLGLFCGNCAGHYRENARCLKRGGRTTCPHCGRCEILDPDKPQHAVLLQRAREARRQRRSRVQDIKAGWVSPIVKTDMPAKSEPQPDREIFRSLDLLLRLLDGTGV